ncbi:potassium channel family protein [Methanomassiliicoccus luminyensis]|uniref:potassium channel family protein n=1 Tax=Methanomassiliicoccus luminyensis TaxID=1080712 RepID=UPI000674F2AB|nr:potassium channel family protein [Methanomassiliicoccus luminyensis]
MTDRKRDERDHWSTPSTAYLLLWASFFVLMMVAPALSQSTEGSIVLTVIYALLLLSSLILIRGRYRVLITAVALVLITAALRLLSHTIGGSGLTSVSFLSSAMALTFISAMIYTLLFRRRKVTTETIWQGMTLYLLTGLAWANLFMFVNTAFPGSFADRANPGAALDLSAFIYYSFVTLTTVGYGDIHPLTPEARNLAGLEMLFGVFYLAIFISRLVETWKIERKSK